MDKFYSFRAHDGLTYLCFTVGQSGDNKDIQKSARKLDDELEAYCRGVEGRMTGMLFSIKKQVDVAEYGFVAVHSFVFLVKDREKDAKTLVDLGFRFTSST